MQPDVETRKVFISYSWSDQPRVLNIVERLLSSGIDVVMDVYDLEPGMDKYLFMERSVNDPAVDYVLIFSSKVYAKKADSREGGVGDEAQILSKRLMIAIKTRSRSYSLKGMRRNPNAYPHI